MDRSATKASPPPARAAVAVLISLVTLSLVGFGIVIPLLPFFAIAYDAEAWQFTLLFSVFSAGQFMGELTWGRISDRIGRRPVLLLTLLLSAAGYLALAFAPNIWLAILARGASGFFAGNVSTVQGYIVDVTPYDRRAGRLGLIGSALALGFVIGPALGGLLAQPELGAVGFRLPLLLASGLCVLAAGGVLAFVRESRITPTAGRKSNSFSAVAAALRHPVRAILLHSTFISFAAFSAMSSIVGLWAHWRFGWGPREIGVLMTAIGLSSAFCQGMLSGFLVRRIGPGATIVGGLTLACASGLIQAFTSWAWLAAAAVLLAIMGHGAAQPATTSLVSRSASPDEQGANLGAASASAALGRVAGPLFAGVLFSAVGPWAPLVFSGLGMLPAAWLGWRAAEALRNVAPN